MLNQINEIKTLFDPNRTYTVRAVLNSEEYASVIEAVRKSAKGMALENFVKTAVLEKAKKTKPPKETGEWALLKKLQTIAP